MDDIRLSVKPQMALVVDKCVDRWFKDNKAIRLIIGFKYMTKI